MEVDRSIFRARIGIGKDQTQDAAHGFQSIGRRRSKLERVIRKRSIGDSNPRPGWTRAWPRTQVQAESKEGVGIRAEIGYSFGRGDLGEGFCRTKRAVEEQESLFLQLLRQVRVAVPANGRHEVEKAVATED